MGGHEMNERNAQSHGKEDNELMYTSYYGYPFILADHDDGSRTEPVSHV